MADLAAEAGGLGKASRTPPASKNYSTGMYCNVLHLSTFTVAVCALLTPWFYRSLPWRIFRSSCGRNCCSTPQVAADYPCI